MGNLTEVSLKQIQEETALNEDSNLKNLSSREIQLIKENSLVSNLYNINTNQMYRDSNIRSIPPFVIEGNPELKKLAKKLVKLKLSFYSRHVGLSIHFFNKLSL